MANPPVAFLGLGGLCSIGLTTPQMAAACRAGISRFADQEWIPESAEPLKVAFVPDEALPALVADLHGVVPIGSLSARWIRLATRPLREATGDAKPRGPVPLFLGTATHADGGTPGSPLLNHLAIQTGLTFCPKSSRVLPHGRAAGLLAMAQAVAHVRETGQAALAAAVDSHADLDRLRRLDAAGRILREEVSDAFVPGEGAACVLLGPPDPDSRETVSVRCLGAAFGTEDACFDSEDVNRGEGLTRVLDQLFADSGLENAAAVKSLYVGLNGESFLAKEFALAAVRHRTSFDPDWVIEHPADCFGDTGAAMGLHLTLIAASDLGRGGRGGPVLVVSASDQPLRAAVLLANDPR